MYNTIVSAKGFFIFQATLNKPSKEGAGVQVQSQTPSFSCSLEHPIYIYIIVSYVLTNLQVFLTSPPAGLVMLPIFTMESENCLKKASGSAQYLLTVSEVE